MLNIIIILYIYLSFDKQSERITKAATVYASNYTKRQYKWIFSENNHLETSKLQTMLYEILMNNEFICVWVQKKLAEHSVDVLHNWDWDTFIN